MNMSETGGAAPMVSVNRIIINIKISCFVK